MKALFRALGALSVLISCLPGSDSLHQKALALQSERPVRKNLWVALSPQVPHFPSWLV